MDAGISAASTSSSQIFQVPSGKRPLLVTRNVSGQWACMAARLAPPITVSPARPVRQSPALPALPLAPAGWGGVRREYAALAMQRCRCRRGNGMNRASRSSNSRGSRSVAKFRPGAACQSHRSGARRRRSSSVAPKTSAERSIAAGAPTPDGHRQRCQSRRQPKRSKLSRVQMTSITPTVAKRASLSNGSSFP